jgi:hypothetical protein
VIDAINLPAIYLAIWQDKPRTICLHFTCYIAYRKKLKKSETSIQNAKCRAKKNRFPNRAVCRVRYENPNPTHI